MACGNEVQRTFVALKPDTVERKLIGKIIQRFEDRGFNILEMRMLKLSRELAEEYYSEHKGNVITSYSIHYTKLYDYRTFQGLFGNFQFLKGPAPFRLKLLNFPGRFQGLYQSIQ